MKFHDENGDEWVDYTINSLGDPVIRKVWPKEKTNEEVATQFYKNHGWGNSGLLNILEIIDAKIAKALEGKR